MPPLVGAQIDLGGKRRTLRYTQPSLRRLQEECGGEPLMETLRKTGQFSAKAISALVWAGLLHEDKRLTIEAVDELIEPPIKPLLDAVMEALRPWISVEEDTHDPQPATAS